MIIPFKIPTIKTTKVNQINRKKIKDSRIQGFKDSRIQGCVMTVIFSKSKDVFVKLLGDFLMSKNFVERFINNYNCSHKNV